MSYLEGHWFYLLAKDGLSLYPSSNSTDAACVRVYTVVMPKEIINKDVTAGQRSWWVKVETDPWQPAFVFVDECQDNLLCSLQVFFSIRVQFAIKEWADFHFFPLSVFFH